MKFYRNGVSQQDPTRRTDTAYISREVVQDIRFQRHVHVDCTRNPAELSLSHIEHSLDATGMFACNLAVEQNQPTIHQFACSNALR